MTDKLRAAAQVALEALELSWADVYETDRQQIDDAIEQLRAALAEPETELVYAFRRKGVSDDFVTCSKARHDELSSKPRLFETAIFYTAPPRREWVGLTDAEIAKIHRTCKYDDSPWSLSRAIEAALKEKNG